MLETQELDVALDISWELLAESTEAIVVKNSGEFFASPTMEKHSASMLDYFLNDPDSSKVFEEEKVKKVSFFSVENVNEDSRLLIIGVPVEYSRRANGSRIHYAIFKGY